MSTQSDHISNTLLAKYFAGEATDTERQSVELWAGSSPENRERFKHYFLVWSDTGVLAPFRNDGFFDVDVAWQNVRINRSRGNRWNRMLVWRVAACIVIFFGLGWIFLSITEEEPVEFVSREQVASVELADGSTVILNHHSQLTYPEEFDGQIRKVELIGEAFFNVRPDTEKPFVIKAGEASIQVLGTSFNVKLDSSGGVFVSVETGRVLFSASDQSLILTAGDKARFIKKANDLVSAEPDKTGADQFWRTRRLSFTGEKLPEVVKILEALYGINISLEQPALANCSIAVTFEDEPIKDILEIIALTLDLQVTEVNHQYILSGKGCPQEPS